MLGLSYHPDFKKELFYMMQHYLKTTCTKLFIMTFISSSLVWSMSEPIIIDSLETQEPENASTSTLFRGPENKAFSNVRVYNTTHTKDLYVEDDAVIGGTLKVKGSIVGAGNVNGPSSSTTNALSRFADNTGTLLKNSTVLISDAGNVTGVATLTANTVTAPILNGTANNTLFVGGQSAANVTAATVVVLTATSDDIPDTIVLRDNVGNFVTTMITLTSEPTNATDATNKRYVDQTAGSGIVEKTPARAMSTANAAITGLYTLDDVVLAEDNRVLLTGQTNPIKNGLWLAHAGAWTRPTDFGNPPTAAGTAYVLTTSGTIYAGSGWICITPDAIIDTNPLSFVQFSSPGSVTGANVGVGTGTIFKNKTGNLINFKSLIAGDNISITNNISGDDITITASALSQNIPNTLVLRDSSGNFSAGTITAALIGTASANVLRSGDTMTGSLTVPASLSTNPSLKFVGSTNTGLSAETPNKLSFSTNGASRMSIDAVGTVTINQFIGSAGVVHNDTAGALSSSLILNADISASANISDTKLATISTPGKVLDSATTATSLNRPNTIVRRDSSGNFSANVITAASIIGAAADNVLRAGDSMTGTFTVIQGSAAQPSLQFVGSSHTGLSAQTPNTLVLSTNGIERMSINATGTVTIPGKLVLAPGSIAQPSLQFTNGTNTGISSPTPDRISFDVNGIERMHIDATSITMIGGAVVFGNVMSITATQTVSLVGGSTPVTINNGISTLVVSYTGPTTISTLTLPSSPIPGQLVTIKAIRLDVGNLDISAYIPAFDPASEAITQLSPNASLAGSQGGASVTYIYLTTAMGAPSDRWYRYGRG